MTTRKAPSSVFSILFNLRTCAAALCASAIAATAFGSATTKPDGTLVDTSSSSGQVIDQSREIDGCGWYKAACAFDGDWSSMSHCWIADLNTTNSTVAYFVYEFNAPTVVDGMTVRAAGEWDPVGRAPNTWTFEGSTNGTDWVVLDTRSGESGWTANQVRSYSFPNRTAYKFYKFACTKNNYTHSLDYYLAIYEIQFYVDSVFDLTSPAIGGVTDSSPAYVWDNYKYLADYAFDSVKNNNGSRWIASRADHMYFVYSFNNPTRVNGISLSTPGSGLGSYTSARAPKDWTFEGSNDGATWAVLDTQSGETDWSEGEDRYYEFGNMAKYKYYKFDCTANNSSSDVLQLMEIEFSFHNTGLPCFGDCSVTRTAATSLLVSAVIDLNGADTLSYILDDGETVTTNAFATSVGENQTKTATISGLSENRTYAVAILAENAQGSTVYPGGSFYTGELALGAVENASEATLAPGTVAVSRASADNVPLTVYYTITGATGTPGVTWVEPVGIVIPAGQQTGYLLVTPLADLAVGENIEVTVTLAAGNYDIPASGNSATLTIENDDTPAGWDVMTIVNAFDNPNGGFFYSNYEKQCLTNTSNRIIRFAKLGSGASGLREFVTEYSSDLYTSYVSRDWLLFAACDSDKKSASTQSSVAVAEADATEGVKTKRTVYTYAGSWKIPADGVYSFRMNMYNAGVFSLDGQLVLRQNAASTAVTTNGVALSAGWHNFCVSFVAHPSQNKVGHATGESLGFSFSPSNAELSTADPGSAFNSVNCEFSTAFNSVLLPYLCTAGGEVMIDCANVVGDFRIAGTLAARDGNFEVVNIPADSTLEVGRPVAISLHGYYSYQSLASFAFVDWATTAIPAGTGVRFEGAVAVNTTWTSNGAGAYTLGNHVVLATDVANFFGALDQEFRYPDGLAFLHVGNPQVLGQTAKVYVPANGGFGAGGKTLLLHSKMNYPAMDNKANYTFENDIELGDDSAVNGTLIWNGGDNAGNILSGDITGDGGLKIFGWSHRLTMKGQVNVVSGLSGQRGCRLNFYPKAGSGPSSISGTVELSGERDNGYSGASLFYCPEIPEEHPFSIGKVNGAVPYGNTIAADWIEGLAYGGRRGSTLSTCSNNTINVGSLIGGGIHLRAVFPPVASGSWSAKTDVEAGVGPANFVFGEINGIASMPIYVSSNVNVTVTNVVKSAAFHYEVMSNSVNAAVLDIEGDCAEGTTITATDVAMLPARVKGFTGSITLTETETKTYPVVFDFDNHGGVPVGGCDGSGTLAAAPSSGTIELSFAGTPPDRGTWGLLRFDNSNGLLDGWTVNNPGTYTVNGKKYGVKVNKDNKGFTITLGKLGMFVTLR